MLRVDQSYQAISYSDGNARQTHWMFSFGMGPSSAVEPEGLDHVLKSRAMVHPALLKEHQYPPHPERGGPFVSVLLMSDLIATHTSTVAAKGLASVPLDCLSTIVVGRDSGKGCL